MQFSEAWLREWANPPWDSATLASRLTMAGFEVEGRTSAAPAFTGVVVGRVLECSRHPKADKLSVCIVTTDGSNRHQIVCGASNVRAGLVGAVALPGATLPGGKAIGAARLRDVDSNGMLCSARELGLGEEGEGILDLPADLPLGADLRQALDLDDMILTVNLTPNRGDVLSVRGLAREISALTGKALPAAQAVAVQAVTDQRFSVRLSAPAACPKFVGRAIRGVKARAQTPWRICERLRRSGLRPISAIVDITNYIMLELGAPMHAYDRAKLDKGIDVRFAARGELITLLDGSERKLQERDLVIADGNGPVGLAGVMGGARTAVSDATTDVFLEAAFFTPAGVSETSRRHGLITDAAQRFERGVDPTTQEQAIERATQLLLEIAGGEAGPLVVTAETERLPTTASVQLRHKQLARLIGAEVPDARAQAILESLGMQVRAGSDGWTVTPPPYRFDIAIEADLIEEVARIFGYDHVEERDAIIRQRFEPLPEARLSADRALLLLSDRGYQEVITYSFVDPKLQEAMFPGSAALMLSNPIAADMAAMRVSLWPGLLLAARENLRRQQDRVRLVESGRKFVVTDGVLSEVATVSGVVAGRALPEQWGERTRPIEFFDVKADLEALLRATGCGHEFAFAPGSHACLRPGRTARVLRSGEPVGWLGELHPQYVRALDLTYAPLVFELEVGAAFSGKLPVFVEISRFPAIRRDLAVVVDEAVPVAAIREHVSVGAQSLLRDLRVFDVYRGAGVDSGRKSVALGLILQESSRTLTDEDADRIMAAVVERLRRELNASIRDQ